MKEFLLTFILFGVFAYCYGAGGAVSTHDTGKSSSQGSTGSSEKTKLLKVGSNIRLDCKNAPNISDPILPWYKNNDPISTDNPHYQFFVNSSLLIKDANETDVGEYRCETVGSTPSKSFNISIVSIVLNKHFPKSTMVVQGEKLNLTCEVKGDPMPTVFWLKDNMTLEESINQSRYTLGPNFAGTERATFIIPVADYEDRALYACFIKTGDLMYNTTTFVRVKDMYAALWPFLGICAEVFILCLIIFIYEKRRAKADFEESDTDQPPEQKNIPEQNKDSVRHRK